VLTVSHFEPQQHPIGGVSLKRILYATDLSESSNAALRYAIELARCEGGQLTIMHVIDDSDRMLWGPAMIAYLDRAKLTEETRRKLDDLIARETPPDMQIERLVVDGKPFRKIVDAAEDRGMDIIVLNLQSKSMLERAIMGSTAERIVRLAHTPVLAVPFVHP
jgi:glycine betaine transporter